MVEEKGEGEKMKRILPLLTDLLLRNINLVIFYNSPYDKECVWS